MKNINPPIITIHAPITMAQIIISFFKAFLFSIFSLFVLQNCIIAVISHSNAAIGRPKIKNSIYFLHFCVKQKCPTNALSSQSHHTTLHNNLSSLPRHIKVASNLRLRRAKRYCSFSFLNKNLFPS